jgi:hypothetical protein
LDRHKEQADIAVVVVAVGASGEVYMRYLWAVRRREDAIEYSQEEEPALIVGNGTVHAVYSIAAREVPGHLNPGNNAVVRHLAYTYHSPEYNVVAVPVHIASEQYIQHSYSWHHRLRDWKHLH